MQLSRVPLYAQGLCGPRSGCSARRLNGADRLEHLRPQQQRRDERWPGVRLAPPAAAAASAGSEKEPPLPGEAEELPETNAMDPLLDYPPELPDLRGDEGEAQGQAGKAASGAAPVPASTAEGGSKGAGQAEAGGAGGKRRGRPRKPESELKAPRRGSRSRAAKAGEDVVPEAPRAAAQRDVAGHAEPLPEAPTTKFTGGGAEEGAHDKPERQAEGPWQPKSEEVLDSLDGMSGNWEVLELLSAEERAEEERRMPHPADQIRPPAGREAGGGGGGVKAAGGRGGAEAGEGAGVEDVE